MLTIEHFEMTATSVEHSDVTATTSTLTHTRTCTGRVNRRIDGAVAH